MKIRADELIVRQKLAPNRSKARALIMAGQVRVGDRVIDKAGTMLDDSICLEVESGPQYVSRGGEKLAHALDKFAITPAGWVCADFGASTGGFADVLLQRGAKHVYAIDVGYGQLDYQLRIDDRVTVMERTNVRNLVELPEQIQFVSVDVSFISLELVFPAIRNVLDTKVGQAVVLVKPQFEAGRDLVGKGGVVRDPKIHGDVLRTISRAAMNSGFKVRGLTASPLLGPAGNREFLMWLGLNGADIRIEAAIEHVLRNPETQN
jgi:23S rRNA (cytidine1920-2'-O)/16S rRNA (cytidine1409-2'-O)-methyltransferase